ncbi:MAG: hypothetical protein RTU30_06440 [Candidatus Thorarchaeota archaeon]
MTQTHRTSQDSRIEHLFVSVSAASIAVILLFSVFYIGYLLTHPELIQNIQQALTEWDFIALQISIDSVAAGVFSDDGWFQVAFGLGLILLSFIFILNVGGVIFSVFIHRSFSAGGTPTIAWWRMSLSRFYLSLRLMFWIALYKTTGLAGFSILQQHYSGNPVLELGFFLSSALSLGTLIVLASVIKVVVYEVSRYETLVETNRTRVSDALGTYTSRWKNEMILVEEALFSNDLGYVKAKLEDATRDMKSDIRLLERARSDLARISSPRGIIRKLLFAFIGVVLIQILTDVILFVGWGTVLEFLTGGMLG